MELYLPISPKLGSQSKQSFVFCFFYPALKNMPNSVADKKQAVCADCELSSPAGQHRDLPLLFWECVDCMTHALMYLSVSAPAIQPASCSWAKEKGRERHALTKLLAIGRDAEQGGGQDM